MYYLYYIFSRSCIFSTILPGGSKHVTGNAIPPEPNLCWCKLNISDLSLHPPPQKNEHAPDQFDAFFDQNNASGKDAKIITPCFGQPEKLAGSRPTDV